MSTSTGLSLIEVFERYRKPQKRVFIALGTISGVLQFLPEISILLGLKTPFSTELEITPVTEELKKEFPKLCKRVQVDPESIRLTTWSHTEYKIIGCSLLYKLFGLKSILCIPAVYESSYKQRHSRGYSKLTIGRINWKTTVGRLIEIYGLPNAFEKCFSVSGLLAVHQYNMWLYSSTLFYLTYVTFLYYCYWYVNLKEFQILLLPMIVIVNTLLNGPMWMLYTRLETYVADSFVIKNFPDLASHGKILLLGTLFFFATMKPDNVKQSFLDRYFYENYSLSKPSTISRLRRLEKCIKDFKTPVSSSSRSDI